LEKRGKGKRKKGGEGRGGWEGKSCTELLRPIFSSTRKKGKREGGEKKRRERQVRIEADCVIRGEGGRGRAGSRRDQDIILSLFLKGEKGGEKSKMEEERNRDFC